MAGLAIALCGVVVVATRDPSLGSEHDDGIDLQAGRERWQADAVVVADGERSRLAWRLGLAGPARRQALALEVDVPFASLGHDTAVLSYRFAGGYGWYFPKGDHANVGVGSYRRSELGQLRRDLASFATELGLDLRQSRVREHWIRAPPRASPDGRQRASAGSGQVLSRGSARPRICLISAPDDPVS